VHSQIPSVRRFLNAALAGALAASVLLPPAAPAWAIGLSKANDPAVLREEASRRMNISFDYDEIQGELKRPAAAAPAPPGEMAQQSTGATWFPRRAPLPLVANSEVVEVTVFRDRALVMRQRRVESTDSGELVVDFTGLPLDIRPESFFAGIADGKAEVLAVERLTGEGLAVREAEQERLRKELRPLVDQVGEARDRIESLLAERAYLREAVVPSGEVATRAPVAEMEKTLAFVAKEERRISAALRAEEVAVEDLDRKIAPMLAKMRDPRADGEKVRVRVRVGVGAGGKKGAAVAVTLRYEVFGSGWSPAYRARLPQDGGRVELSYDGVVRQFTGEDWSDARLVLSTADAGAPGAPPALVAWTLEEGQPYWEQQAAYGSPARSGVFVGSAEGGGRGGSPGGPGAAAGSPSARAAVVFEVPGRWTVRGDGSEQRLPIATLAMDAREERVAVPRSAPQVFRKAKLVHGGGLPLLSGPVALFVGPDMVASAQMAAVAPGEDFELHFGGDEQMKAERVVLERKQEYVGVGKKQVRWTFKYEIRLRNFRDHAVTVRVGDQLPVAVSERVVVKALDMSPPLPADPRDPQGVLRWDLSVPAGGEAKIQFGFQVTSPAEVSLYELMAL
jgi:uncharacterized protein (TIGR02231 family)